MKQEYQKVHELIQDIKTAMLTTITEDGSLHSRPMTSQDMDEEGNLWFFTSDSTSQAHEVEEHHELNLAYVGIEDGSYVSVSGTGELVRDHVKAEELWNPALKAWFPRGLDEPDLVLLKVRMQSAEYWDAPQGKMINLFKIAKAAITGVPFQSTQAEHGRANFNRH